MSKIDFTVIERTYTAVPKNNVVCLVTNSLPIYWTVRINSGKGQVYMIGHDDSVDISKTKTTMTVSGRNAYGLGRLYPPQNLTAVYGQEQGFTLNVENFVSYTLNFRIEIPVSRTDDVVIDFKSPEIDYDRIMVIQEEKFHVNSAFLSVWSNFFKKVFTGEFTEKDKKEITLEGVDPAEFEELLKVIYPTRKDIDASNVAYLWKLADYLDMPFVIRMCEQYLLSGPGFYMLSLSDILDLALDMKSKKLEEKCRKFMKKITFEE